ncbi:MAG TPA: DUF2171 domain-containing protein [Kofleriaceae bacterium]|jgi:hypothetical protein|nr:DUF2171 domain-containing protein [Kofleriaceae bacterium]
MLDSETARNLIKPHMAIVCSNDKQFATVDGVGNNAIKVTRDQAGKHHYIPLIWVTSVDDRVHIDRPGDQAMADWLDNPPVKA